MYAYRDSFINCPFQYQNQENICIRFFGDGVVSKPFLFLVIYRTPYNLSTISLHCFIFISVYYFSFGLGHVCEVMGLVC